MAAATAATGMDVSLWHENAWVLFHKELVSFSVSDERTVEQAIQRKGFDAAFLQFPDRTVSNPL